MRIVDNDRILTTSAEEYATIRIKIWDIICMMLSSHRPRPRPILTQVITIEHVALRWSKTFENEVMHA